MKVFLTVLFMVSLVGCARPIGKGVSGEAIFIKSITITPNCNRVGEKLYCPEMRI